MFQDSTTYPLGDADWTYTPGPTYPGSGWPYQPYVPQPKVIYTPFMQEEKPMRILVRRVHKAMYEIAKEKGIDRSVIDKAIEETPDELIKAKLAQAGAPAEPEVMVGQLGDGHIIQLFENLLTWIGEHQDLIKSVAMFIMSLLAIL